MVPAATKALHPTAQKLVDTVKEMLKETPYNNIKSENVLFRSKISRVRSTITSKILKI